MHPWRQRSNRLRGALGWSTTARTPTRFVNTAATYSRWQSATKVTVQRQGQLVAFAIGGAARVIVDQIGHQALRDGVVADFQDGRGNVDHSGVELVFRVLEQHLPPDEQRKCCAQVWICLGSPLAPRN